MLPKSYYPQLVTMGQVKTRRSADGLRLTASTNLMYGLIQYGQIPNWVVCKSERSKYQKQCNKIVQMDVHFDARSLFNKLDRSLLLVPLWICDRRGAP